MAYNLKYTITSATKNNTISVVEMYIDEVVSSVIDYPGVSVELQYIPKSDNIFEPIYASQLSVVMDVTDDEDNLPNFVSLNDRKYLVKLKIDGVYQWTGWALSDNVQYMFTTGRKELKFDAIDGLGILDYFPYPFVETTSVSKFSPILILDFITNCFQQIGFPDALNIYTVCSYYSSTMQNRNDHTYSEPFSQAYIRANYYLNSDGTYETCSEVLSKIAKSFGCRIYQANNKWNIVAVNEMASNSYFYTEYTYNGTLATYGVASIVKTIEGYTGNTTGLYFVDNSQLKIFKKGYNNFVQNYNLKYSPNYIGNNNLKTQVSGVPVLWTTGVTGTGGSVTLVPQLYEASDRFNMITGTSGTAYIIATVSSAIQNDTITYSHTFYNQEIAKKRGKLILQVSGTGGAQTYYFNVDKIWQDATTAPFDNQYLIDSVDTNEINNFSISTPPLPVSGQLSLRLEIFDSPTCSNAITVGDFNLSFQSPISLIKTTSILSADNQYTLELDLPFGYPVYSGDGINRAVNNPALGTILVSSGGNFVAGIGWYKFGVIGTYLGLSQLITKEYINAYRRNLINLDANIFGIENSGVNLSGGSILKTDDSDPTQINVSNKFYMLGNMTMNIINSEIQATLLDISNTAIESTILTIYIVNGINYN